MSYVCDRIGLESILDGFDLYRVPCFSISQGKDLKFTHIGDEVSEARDVLETNLLGLHPGSTALYKIKFYDAPNNKGVIDKSTPEIGSFTFKMSSSDVWPRERNALPAASESSAALQMMAEQNKMILELLERMAVKEAPFAEISGIQEEEEESVYEKIGRAVDTYPALKEIANRAFDFLEGLSNKIFNKTEPTNRPLVRHSAAVSGVKIEQDMDSNQKLIQVVDSMIKAPTKEEAVENLNRLAEALRKCVERDPEFLDVLVDLSNLPEKKYNMAKTFL